MHLMEFVLKVKGNQGVLRGFKEYIDIIFKNTRNSLIMLHSVYQAIVQSKVYLFIF